MAELKFFGYLADFAGTRAKEVMVERPTRLREMVPSGFPESNIVILVNEKAGTLDTVIANEDSVAFMPILSGG